MENIPAVPSSTTEVEKHENGQKKNGEIEALLKKTLKAIGRLTILAYEIENDQIQLNTMNISDTAMNPVISSRYTKQKEALNKKSEALLEETTTSVKGISEIAEKYRELFSSELDKVKNEIENAMVEYGDILSKDTLERINKERTRLTDITDKQAKTVEQLTNDFKSKTQQLDDKLNQVKVTLETQSGDSTKLFTASNKVQQANTTLETKIITIQQKMDEMAKQFEQNIKKADLQTVTQIKTMESVSTALSNTMKHDKDTFLKRLATLEEDRQADKKLLESLQSELNNLKQQTESLQQQQKEITTSPSPPPSSPSPTDQSTTTTVSSILTDKDVINMKSTIGGLQTKCNSLVLLINSLVKDEIPVTTETLENLQANMSLKRLDDMEKNVIYLLSKVEVMEPRLKLDFAEVRRLLESKGVIAEDQKIPSVGDKRTLDMMNGGNSSSDDSIDDNNESRIEKLEREVRVLDHKLGSLVGHIYQFRSNILHPDFPDKLDSGLQHLESVLRNHEMVITYLMDPVTASNNENQNDSSLTITELEKQRAINHNVSPALLTAITKLIADKTRVHFELQQTKKRKEIENGLPEYMETHMERIVAEQMKPLQNRIKDLEQQLSSSSG